MQCGINDFDSRLQEFFPTTDITCEAGGSGAAAITLFVNRSGAEQPASVHSNRSCFN